MPPAPSCCNCNVKSKPHTIPTSRRGANRYLRQNRTRRSQRTGGTDPRQSRRHRGGQRPRQDRPPQKTVALFPDNQVGRRLPPHRRRDKTNLKPDGQFESFDTICRQVANRIPNIREFARRHDLILFVCGKKSLQRTGAFRRMPASQSPIPTRFRHQ